MVQLRGKTALITGAGCGIGKACAFALADAGAHVIVNDRPGGDQLADICKEIEHRRGSCLAIEADVFNRGQREGLVEASVQAAGSIDILVSNPALNLRAPFLDLDVADFQRVLESTLISGFHMSQLVARGMVAAGRGGKIIFMSSVLAEMPFANNIAYGAAKAGLNQMARTISVELASHQINVNSIEPGWIDTPGERAWCSEEEIEQRGKLLPLGRMGASVDIANAVLFLSSPASDYITGTAIPVDGGFRFKAFLADD